MQPDDREDPRIGAEFAAGSERPDRGAPREIPVLAWRHRMTVPGGDGHRGTEGDGRAGLKRAARSDKRCAGRRARRGRLASWVAPSAPARAAVRSAMVWNRGGLIRCGWVLFVFGRFGLRALRAWPTNRGRRLP
jgi:hypothetical protein